MARLNELADVGCVTHPRASVSQRPGRNAEGIPEGQRKFPVCPLDTGVDPERGLTPRGRAVIERMVTLRMIPDVTHCTPVARQDVYQLVANRVPVIASHIGVQSMNSENYNLDEADVRAIARSGGVIGVIFMPYWLDRSHPGPGLDAIWRTMDQLREWSGNSWEHVAIGTDFDGFTDPPDDCDSEAKLPLIREMLEARVSSRSEVEAVAGGNARRVLRHGWR